VDSQALASTLEAALPFPRLVGVEYVSITKDEAVARLPDAPELANHIGSQHAGALFTVAETASVAAVVGAFADDLERLIAIPQAAQIQYVNVAHGPVEATARVTSDLAAVRAQLEGHGRAQLATEAELSDEDGLVVASATVNWLLRIRRRARRLS
jgi:uncharacterized protein (TIGR00369 family)